MAIVRVSVRYAKALYQTASEQQLLEKIREDADFILSTIHQSADLQFLLDNPVVKTSEKSKAIKALFSTRVSPLSLSFLDLVVEKKRESMLADVFRNFIQLYKKEKGIMSAVLTTVYPIGNTERSNLLEWLEKHFKSRIELHEQTNPALKGGFLLRVEDMQMDMSVSHRIREMKKQLINTEFEKKY